VRSSVRRGGGCDRLARMSTPYESANLILKIFEMRREPSRGKVPGHSWVAHDILEGR
jgi:hypothetical protein